MIPLLKLNLTWRESLAVVRQVRSSRIGPGKTVWQFEREFAEAIGRKHAVAVNSGTTGLLLSLWAGGIRHGHAVSFPACAFPSGANAAKLVGCNVGLVDVRESTGCLDPQALDTKGTGEAVIFVRHNGQGIDDAALVRQLCGERDQLLVEDACQALGCSGAGRYGEVAVFSFSPQKLITTGQGGMVVTDDDELFDKLDAYRDHGGANWRSCNWHARIGGNFRMTDIQAAMGLTQLRRLPKLVKRRRRILGWYVEHGLPATAWQTDAYCAVYRTCRPSDAIAALRIYGVDARKLYRPMHHHGPYQAAGISPAEDKRFPVATKLADETIYLPSHLAVTRHQVRYVCEVVRRFEGV